MAKRLVLATKNKGKVRELVHLLEGTGIDVVDLSGWPDFVMPEETGETFEENAVLKAAAVARGTGEWALADDSGLEVDAIGGAPGVRSARYAGERASDAENNDLLLKALGGVPAERRDARFVSAVALCSPSGDCVTRRGTCAGVIRFEPRGTGGFGYDPLFFVPAEGATFAELPQERKNQISHRANAFMAIRQEIIERMRG